MLNIISLIIAKYLLYYILSKRYHTHSSLKISPKNFTLLCKVQTTKMLTGFQNLESFLTEVINVNKQVPPIQFKKINPIYDIKQYLDVIQELMLLEKKIAIVKSKIEFNFFGLQKKQPDFKKLEDKKIILREKLKNLSESLSTDNLNKFTGWVFITFHSVQDLKKVHRISSSSLHHFWFSFYSNWRTVPEPNDVIWENWSVPLSRRIIVRIVIFISLFVIIGVNFAIILGLNYLQPENSENSGMIKSAMISLAISVIIGIVNFLIKILLIYLTKFETYKTQTEHSAEIVFKVLVSLFANKAIIVLIVIRIIKNDWLIFGTSGVLSTIFISMIVNVFFDIILYIFDPFYLLKLYKRRLMRKQNENNGKGSFLQCEVNEAYEGIEFDISEAYYLNFATISFAFFYQAILPYGLLLGIIECSLKYIVIKYILLKRCKKPHDLEFQFTTKMIRQFEFCICILAIGFVSFAVIFRTNNSGIDGFYIASLCLGGYEFLIGINAVKHFFENPFSSEIKNTFDSYEANFPVDYDRLNPMSQKKAFREFVNKIKLDDPSRQITLDQILGMQSSDEGMIALEEYAIFGNRKITFQDKNLLQKVLQPGHQKRGGFKLNVELNSPNLYQFQDELLRGQRKSVSKPKISDSDKISSEKVVDYGNMKNQLGRQLDRISMIAPLSFQYAKNDLEDGRKRGYQSDERKTLDGTGFKEKFKKERDSNVIEELDESDLNITQEIVQKRTSVNDAGNALKKLQEENEELCNPGDDLRILQEINEKSGKK